MSQFGWYKLSMMLFVCLFIACSKKNASTPVDAGLKKYFSYKPGTYWIYYDSVNLETDSFAITDNYVQQFSDNNGNSYDYETDKIIAYKNGVGSFSSEWYLYNKVIRYEYDSRIATINYDPLFTFPYLQSGLFFSNGFAEYENIGNYQINNTNYTSVLKIYFISVKYNYNDTLLVSPDAGIIKMSIHHQRDTVRMIDSINYRWSLISFNIKH
ncbi:MAG: hypothetical protein ACHQD8_05085 [Chitinophagales bacterium]